MVKAEKAKLIKQKIIMIDIKRYIEKKEKKLVSVAKIGNAFVISQKRFDVETGEELDPEVQGFNLEDLEEIKLNLQKAIADIDSLIENINAL